MPPPACHNQIVENSNKENLKEQPEKNDALCTQNKDVNYGRLVRSNVSEKDKKWHL